MWSMLDVQAAWSRSLCSGPSGSKRKPPNIISVGTVKSVGTNSIGTRKSVSSRLAVVTPDLKREHSTTTSLALVSRPRSLRPRRAGCQRNVLSLDA